MKRSANGYPKEAAARVAVEAVKAFIANEPSIAEVIFVCLSFDDLATYRTLL